MNDINKTLSRNKKIALTGALSALDIVLVITNLGFIPISPVASPTILHIPVIIAVLLAGLPEGLFVGGVFGIASLIKASMSPAGALDPLFINPFCSVLPRILIAVIAWAVWKLFNLVPKMPKIVSAGITALITTIAHTLLVIGSLFLIQGKNLPIETLNAGFWAAIIANIFNIILECSGAIIISVAVYTGIYIASKKKSKLSSEIK